MKVISISEKIVICAIWGSLVGCTPQDPQKVLDSELAAAKKAIHEVALAEQKRHEELALKKKEELMAAMKATEGKIAAEYVVVRAKLNSLSEKIASIESSTKNLDFTLLKEQLGNLRIDMMLRDLDGVAVIRPADTGNYKLIRHDLGFMTISLEDVVAYASGTKIVISLGNPLMAKLTRVTMSLEYVAKGDDGKAMHDAAVTKSHSVDKLPEGTFTKTVIVLEEVKPDRFAYMRVKDIEIGGIVLSVAK